MGQIILNVVIVVLIVLVAVMAGLYFFGRKAQKKQAAQKQQMDAMAQTVTMLVIDKKKLPLKDAGFPAQVLEQTPRLMRRTKLPIVKAKIGPKVTSLIADSKIYDSIPVKKEVKAVISGLYITEVRGIRGPLEVPEKKKKGLMTKLRNKAEKLTEEANQMEKENAKNKNKKKKK